MKPLAPAAVFVLVTLAGCSSEAPPAGGDAAGGDAAGGDAAGSDAAGTDAAVAATGETGCMIGMTAARARTAATPPILPLECSTDLAAVAQAWSERLASTDSYLVDSGNGYGENPFWVSGSTTCRWFPWRVAACSRWPR